MYHLHPIKGFHFSEFHAGSGFQQFIHDERVQAVAVAVALIAIVTFAVWLGSL
ncbi:MAG: hypothetical protein K9M75_08660 [Phycisphaerae bacterium]|nr:hypothetical protein [Phycisphaerae bacterium]